METLRITRPDDWHIHLRDGAWLKRTVADAAKYCARALVMPNLSPPIKTLEQAHAYRNEILATLDDNLNFDPHMALYLCEDTDPAHIPHAAQDHKVIAYKLYPAQVTTGSAMGIKRIESTYPVLEQMQKYDLALSVHAETPDHQVDVFDREAHFLEHYLEPIVRMFPSLKVVVEHISTAAAVEFTRSCGKQVAATITAHHLLYTRNDLLGHGIKPHYYCAPVLKRSSDREAIRKAATSGEPQFFMGTDSAPHRREDKLSACGCAGCYTACSALSDYAQIFEQHKALDHLEGFTSFAGADFYGLERNQTTIELSKSAWQIPETVSMGNREEVVPMDAGQTRIWQISANH